MGDGLWLLSAVRRRREVGDLGISGTIEESCRSAGGDVRADMGKSRERDRDSMSAVRSGRRENEMSLRDTLSVYITHPGWKKRSFLSRPESHYYLASLFLEPPTLFFLSFLFSCPRRQHVCARGNNGEQCVNSLITCISFSRENSVLGPIV
jgi:hypothetical protein